MFLQQIDNKLKEVEFWLNYIHY